MTFKFEIESFSLSDGSTIHPPKRGVTAIVGPNNAGKSAALRELVTKLSGNDPTLVVVSLELIRAGSNDELIDWLSQRNPRYYERGGEENFAGEEQGFALRHTFEWTMAGPPMQNNAHSLYVKLLTGENRIGLANAGEGFRQRHDPAKTPLQRLFNNPGLERRISRSCKAAFGVGVALDRLGGTSLGLFMGDPLPEIGDIGDYNSTFEGYQPLEAQGDGLRSYVGILLVAMASDKPVLLIDEPEAFLHPPQARMLGRELAEIAAEGRQVVVATHSDDFVRGLLGDATGDTTIIRITRDGDVNPSRVIDAAGLLALWQDPLLRYSQVIGGLFHEGVVICESDADCRFYEVAMSEMASARQLRLPDLLFVHTGGKHRIPVVAGALTSIGVPVVIVPDLDVLREKALVEKLIDSVGGDQQVLEAAWSTVSSGVEGLTPQNPVGFVKDQIDAAFAEHSSVEMTAGLRKAIQGAVKGGDGWSAVKRGGVAALPAGECSAKALSLLQALQGEGIFVTPVGELEGWDKSVGGHGPKWVSDAIANSSHASNDHGLFDFLEALVAHVTPTPT